MPRRAARLVAVLAALILSGAPRPAAACGPTWTLTDIGLGFDVGFKDRALIPRPPRRPSSWRGRVFPLYFHRAGDTWYLDEARDAVPRDPAAQLVCIDADTVRVRGEVVGARTRDGLVLGDRRVTITVTELLTGRPESRRHAIRVTVDGVAVIDQAVTITGCDADLRTAESVVRRLEVWAVWRALVWPTIAPR